MKLKNRDWQSTYIASKLIYCWNHPCIPTALVLHAFFNLFSILQATQSLENTGQEESGKTATENGQQEQQLSPEADKGAIRRSSSGGFIVSKPDPSILSMGLHIRQNYRGGGRGEYQRQPTLPSLPELEDTPGAMQEEEGEGEGELAGKEEATELEAHSTQQHKLLTTL